MPAGDSEYEGRCDHNDDTNGDGNDDAAGDDDKRGGKGELLWSIGSAPPS